MPGTNFFVLGLTWDKTADAMTAWLNGARQGTTQHGLGLWSGSLDSNAAVIGAVNTSPSQSWSGSLGPVALGNAALSAAAIARLAVVN